MSITLRIDNLDALPDGGPMHFSANQRGFDIGRESHLDWTLPDPTRMISGRHAEIRYEYGGYVLYDVSRNGTFLNGSHQRVKSPYRLADGDRLQIGQYILAVSVHEASPIPDAGASVPAYAPPPSEDAIWDAGGPAPPPISRRELMPPPARGHRAADFAEQYIELPGMRPANNPFGEPAQASPFGGSDPFASPQRAPAPPPPRADSPFGPAPTPVDAFGAPQRAPEPVAPLRSESPFGPAPEPVAPPQMRPMPSGDPRPATPAGEAFAPVMPRPAPPPPDGYGQAQPAYAPPPAYQPQPQPAYAQPAQPQPGAQGGDQVLSRFAQGAGVGPQVFAGRDPGDVAEEVGRVLRVAVEELTALLKARAAAKVLAKSGSRTMVSAADNNPLKFIPRAEEALEIMFGKSRPGYMDARRAMEESFRDLKTHEFATYAAMQRALSRLLEDLSPEAIDKKVASSAFASKKARAWDTFVATWEAKAEPHENGMLDVFLTYFADAYEKATKPK